MASRRTRRVAAGVLWVAVLVLSSRGWAGEDGQHLAVRGRFIDESGAGVPGQVARVLKSRTYLKVGGLRSLDQSVEDGRATSDALGFFEIETRADSQFPYVYLRFFDPKTFDAVQFRMPEDREITRRVRSGRAVEVTVPLQRQPDWPKVKRLLDTYPPGSQVGQVLRSLGLPSSTSPEGPARELWTYEKAGVAYVIEGSKVVETRSLPPGAAGAATATGKDETTPAVRVDKP